jgi:hypothetical protein
VSHIYLACEGYSLLIPHLIVLRRNFFHSVGSHSQPPQRSEVFPGGLYLFAPLGSGRPFPLNNSTKVRQLPKIRFLLAAPSLT